MTTTAPPQVEGSRDGHSSSASTPRARRTDATADLAPIQRAVLAALLFGAALIHLGMVPQHMNEWAVEGIAFLLVGLAQVGLAAAVLWRPRRWVLVTTVIASIVFASAWLVTRTSGSPWGPAAELRQPATFVDSVCAGLEFAAVLFALFALWRPRFARTWTSDRLVPASIVPLAVVVLAAGALASPSASNHAHANGGCPKDFKPNPELVSADGHAHSGAEACVVADDKGFSALSNGHHHAIRNEPLDPATQAELDRQLDVTRQVAARYPTIADAAAAGYRRAGPYTPGLGVHYTKSGAAELNAAGVMTDDTLQHPQALIYAGTDPGSPIAGFMYYSTSKIEPTGFPGTNDTWHYHTNTCITFGPTGIDAPYGADRSDVTKEMCTAVGGVMLTMTQWMVHVWSVPGWENESGGVFAEVNPKLGCSDGTYYRITDEEMVNKPLNTCVSGAAGDPTAST